MKYRLALFSGVVLLFYTSHAQELNVDFKDRPLSLVIIEIRDSLDLYFSFNEVELAKYSISLSGHFTSIESFLDEALSQVPFTWEKSGPVILIIPEEVIINVSEFRLKGQVVDKYTHETLPYSHILVNDVGMITDRSGNFCYESKKDSVFTIRVSYLGYYITDTTVFGSNNLKIALTPSFIGLAEVVVEGKLVDFSSQIGENPGEVKLNHIVARFLPGYGDNSVFNLLRLQPGIMAAGEKSDYLTIWGSYDGQNQIIFDGFTLFGLKNYSDQISSVNPFMVKDMQVMKGGYGARYGEKTGGIININGIDGNRNKPTLNLLVNNLTLNGMVSVPVVQKSTLSLAFRQTYYNLYRNEDLKIPARDRGNGNFRDLSLIPNYDFNDLNIKYAGETRGSDIFFISAYTGKDIFSYNFDYEFRRSQIIRSSSEENKQKGLGALYNKVWGNGNQSKIQLNYSSLLTKFNLKTTSENISSGRLINEENKNVRNEVIEYNAILENRVNIGNTHNATFGIGFELNTVSLKEVSNDISLIDTEGTLSDFILYAEDVIQILPQIDLVPGIRINYPQDINKLYLQPRCAVNCQLNNYWKAGAAWGIYNQFVIKNMVLDSLANRYFLWLISNNDDIPVLDAQHYVLSLNREKNDFELNIEGYYKTIKGIIRVIHLTDEERNTQEYETQSYGIDLYVKKDLGKHSIWIAYSLGKTKEIIELDYITITRRALQDQRHEFKLATLFNFDPIFLSANYVYGSGFRDPLNELEDIPYNRCDAAIIYRFRSLKFKLEAGISVMNVFNTVNMKYENLYRIPSDVGTINIYAEAVPFSPSVFLNIGF